MPASFSNTPRSVFNLAGIALLTLLLAGCAQQRAPGYYDVAHDSTLSDAQAQAQGQTGKRAASQIQLGFGDTQKPKEGAQTTSPEQSADKAAIAATVRPLAEAKTFLGTLPCLSTQAGCSATRVTLTLAPAGQWRARTVTLGMPANEQSTITEQGCWDVIGNQPWRIVLRNANQGTKASLTFTNDNVLMVNSINDTKPALDYRLTRQPDIDGIDELNGKPALQCEK